MNSKTKSTHTFFSLSFPSTSFRQGKPHTFSILPLLSYSDRNTKIIQKYFESLKTLHGSCLFAGRHYGSSKKKLFHCFSLLIWFWVLVWKAGGLRMVLTLERLQFIVFSPLSIQWSSESAFSSSYLLSLGFVNSICAILSSCKISQFLSWEWHYSIFTGKLINPFVLAA